jgi:hypothetical protein
MTLVECLPHMYKALGLIPYRTKKSHEMEQNNKKVITLCKCSEFLKYLLITKTSCWIKLY